MKNHPLLIVLIGLNAAVFVAQLAGFDFRETGALWLLQNPDYRGWQWFSHLFLHADVMHLLLNMYGLGMFGAPLLAQWGGRRFLLMYFVSGLFGAALYMGWSYVQFENGLAAFVSENGLDANEVRIALNYGAAFAPEPLLRLFYQHMIGASGAVFGVLAAFSLRFPNVKLSLLFLPFGVPARYFVFGLVAYEVFAQFSGVSLFGSNIAHLAHVGGALSGWLFALYWRNVWPEPHHPQSLSV